MALELITQEEISNMSEAEMLAWLKELDAMEETVAKRMQKEGFSMQGPSLTDIEQAYSSPEFIGFSDNMAQVDYPATVFEDKEDIDAVNKAYEKVTLLSKDASHQEKEDVYMPLYSALYSYIRRVNPLWGEGAKRLSIWASLQEEFRTVYTLTKKSAESFKKLIAPEEYEHIGEGNVYTLGSVRWRDGKETAAGVLIFSVFSPEDASDEPVAKIDWPFVAEEFRGTHAADDLMAAMYDVINKSGIEAVTCEVPMKNMLPAMVCDFLSAWHIFFSLEPFEEFSSTVGEIAENEKLSGDITESVKVGSLKKMGADNFVKTVCAIMRAKGDKKYVLDNAASLDPELSLIAVSPSGKKAFLLIDHTPSGMLKVRAMGGDSASQKIFLDLIKYAVKRSHEVYEPQTQVFAHISSDSSAKLFDHLFPGHGLPMHLVGVNLSAQDDITPEIFDYFRFLYEQEK